MAQAVAIYKNARISPMKVRPLARTIANQKVSDALNMLSFSQLKAAGFLRKTLMSAVANVENNLGDNADNFFIRQILVDQARVMKRINIRARGRADRILKPSCHIKLVLRDS